MPPTQSIATTVRKNFLRLAVESGMIDVLPQSVIEAGFEDLELGLGQLLGDVERAHRRGISLAAAVHAHEKYPYLSRTHGSISDALHCEVPDELLPWLRRAMSMPTTSWAIESRNALCVIVRSDHARTEERALARFVLFEGIRLNLFLAARNTDGHFEGIGGCGRDLDDIAWKELSNLLEVPLVEDAFEAYRPFEVLVTSAMESLVEFSEALLEAQIHVQELRQACADATELERLLRKEDPRDAAILRNKFSRSHHRQRIPVARLPLEHPMLLGGYSEDAINQRSSRATNALRSPIDANSICPTPIILADVLTDTVEIQDA